MLRLIGFFVMLVIGAGGFLAIDYNMARQTAADENKTLAFSEYIVSFPERFSSPAEPVEALTPPPVILADMLPTAPEGWTMRAMTREDIREILPNSAAKTKPEILALVKSVGATRVGNGAEVVAQTYERGERWVVVQLIRYPDAVFSGFESRKLRYDLRMATMSVQARPFMTVRGLPVTEVFLGDGVRGRMFMADVGAQIQLRILASRRMSDDDLVPLFQALPVQAMNDAVVERQEGLGEVPVIALASAMSEPGLAAYQAEHTARKSKIAALAKAELEAAEASALAAAAAAGTPAPAAAAAEKPKPGLLANCEKSGGGIKRCKVQN